MSLGIGMPDNALDSLTSHQDRLPNEVSKYFFAILKLCGLTEATFDESKPGDFEKVRLPGMTS